MLKKFNVVLQVLDGITVVETVDLHRDVEDRLEAERLIEKAETCATTKAKVARLRRKHNNKIVVVRMDNRQYPR